MSKLSRDPDRTPEIPASMFREAEALGFRIVNIVCDEHGAKPGDAGALNFAAMVPELPRAGERITLEDGRACEVNRIYWKTVARRGKDGHVESIALMPTVVAHLIKSEP